MGNVLVSTDETEIYYPTKWLVDGGPTYGAVGCPTRSKDDEWRVDELSLSWNPENGRWAIIQQNNVVMESSNMIDVLQFYKDFMQDLVDFFEANP